MMRRWSTLALAIAAVALAAAGAALALPQQQGSVDLLNQADGQWDGPGEGQGGSNAGAAVVGLGDIFHNGVSALAIGAPEANPGGRQSAGSVYVVAGQTGTRAVDLTALSGRGYRIDGADAGDQLGYSLAALTLANGDAALAIGAPDANPDGRSEAGRVYVIDLRKLRRNLTLSNTPGGALVSVINGPTACAQLGFSIAASQHWLMLGAPGWAATGCPSETAGGPQGGDFGAAFALALKGLGKRLDLASTSSPAEVYEGATSGDLTGTAVSVTPKGWFAIGAPYASGLGRTDAGQVYLVPPPTKAASVSLRTPPAGSSTIFGVDDYDATGTALAATTAFKRGQRPGTIDLLIGAPQANPKGRIGAGEVYVVALPLPRWVDLAGKRPGVGVIDGADAGDGAGSALAGVGSINGSGVPSIVIGAPFVNSQTGTDRIDNGAAYVLYGGVDSGNLDLASLDSRGFIAFGARNSDEAGSAVAGVVNSDGDGRPGLLIGAPYAESEFGSSPTEGGDAYAIFGWGTPLLRYRTRTVLAFVGHRIKPLRPVIKRTGAASFTVSPALPRGLKLNARTGVISGTPRALAAVGFYTVQMVDQAGAADATLQIAVEAGAG
jgi:hypothetical protein